MSLPSFIGQPFQGIANAAAIVINKIPWYIWLALGALAVVATGAIGAASRSSRRVRRQAGAMAAVSAAALTDPLTGVLNRRGFTEAVERELARARRYDRPFVLAYVDVRGLKAVNDTEGHLAGDELLKGVLEPADATQPAPTTSSAGWAATSSACCSSSSPPRAPRPVTAGSSRMLPERHAEMEHRAPLGPDDRHRGLPEDGKTFNELLAGRRRLYEQRGIALSERAGAASRAWDWAPFGALAGRGEGPNRARGPQLARRPAADDPSPCASAPFSRSIIATGVGSTSRSTAR